MHKLYLSKREHNLEKVLAVGQKAQLPLYYLPNLPRVSPLNLKARALCGSIAKALS